MDRPNKQTSAMHQFTSINSLFYSTKLVGEVGPRGFVLGTLQSFPLRMIETLYLRFQVIFVHRGLQKSHWYVLCLVVFDGPFNK